MIDSMEQEDFYIRNQQPVTSRARDLDNALRPLNFEDFSGQDKVVDNLRIFEMCIRDSIRAVGRAPTKLVSTPNSPTT